MTIAPLPNSGDECVEQGVTWGHHGEAALVPWEVTGTGGTWATLETRLFTVPLRIEREFTLDGPVLRLAETVTNESPSGPRGDVEPSPRVRRPVPGRRLPAARVPAGSTATA